MHERHDRWCAFTAWRTRLLAGAWMAAATAPLAEAIVLEDPTSYAVKRTWSGDSLGIPAELGGLLFSADGETLYVVGGAGQSQGAVYAVPIVRDAMTGEVVDLGPAGAVSTLFEGSAFALDAGLDLGPAGTLFYTYWDANVLGQRPGGGSGDETAFLLDALGVDVSISGLAFSPHLNDAGTGFAQLQISSWDIIFLRSTVHDLPLTPAGGGIFTPGAASPWVVLPNQAVGGMQYVPAGTLAGHLMHVNWLDNELRVLMVDRANGLPLDGDAGTGVRNTPNPVDVLFASDVVNPWGLDFDPSFADLFVGTNGSTPPNVIVQIGPTTTTTTTTTTTLPPMCAHEPTYPSIRCRLDLLLAEVRDLGDLGRLSSRLARPVEKAGARTAASEVAATEGQRRKARSALSRGRRALSAFLARLRSPAAQRKIAADLRTLLETLARATRDDVRALRRAM